MSNELLVDNSFGDLRAKYESATMIEGADPVKRLKIYGTAIVCGRPGINGRSYPLSIMKKEANNFIKTRVKTGRAGAELNHPRLDKDGDGKDYSVFEINLKKACALIEEITFSGNNMKTKMVVAEEHSAGSDLKALIDIGYRPGFSLRGAGSVTQSPNGYLEVADDYKLITIDVVGNPSFDDDAIFDNMYESIKSGNLNLLTEAADYAAQDFMKAMEVNASIKTGRKKYNTAALGNLFAENALKI
jgi:hypothetical protein